MTPAITARNNNAEMKKRVFHLILSIALDIKALAPFSQSMKITKIQMEKIARAVLDELKSKNQIVFKAPEEKVYQRAFELVQEDFAKEAELDKQVHAMMDELEKNSSEEFQRYKMFPLLKKRLAKEKGVVL